MPYLIGTDEAGYGPNLGPLTITATLWETPSESFDLYDGLVDVVCGQRPPRSKDAAIPTPIWIADSKSVYASSSSIATLERNVLALVDAAAGCQICDWQSLTRGVCGELQPNERRRSSLAATQDLKELDGERWLQDGLLKLPLAATAAEVESARDRFLLGAAAANVRLVAIRSVAIFPKTFNARIKALGNKATLLSAATLQLVRSLLEIADDDVEVHCDKHGGRSQYAAMIQQFVTQSSVSIGDEGRESSDYFFRESNRDVVMRFQAKGESQLPVALASMVSKYLREVFMELWNQFWVAELPGLKPTKGYPVDAKRFKEAISKRQSELGIADDKIWRVK